MQDRIISRILFAAALTLGLVTTPSFALAANDAESEEATQDEEVELDDMLSPEARADRQTGHHGETLEQRSGERDRGPNWTSIITLNALAGGVAGGLVGGAVTLLRGVEFRWRVIGQYAAVGVLVGTTIGIIELLTLDGNDENVDDDETRALQEHLDETPASLEWLERDVPTTFGTDVIRIDF